MNNTELRSRLSSLILILFSFIALDVHATHLVGGSLNYEYIGQNPDGTYRYRIYSSTFTDCGPDSDIQFPENQISVGVYVNDENNPDADKVRFASLAMPLINAEEVTLETPGGGVCNVGSDVCLIRGDYETFVNLDLNFGGYWLYYDRCCRNDAVVSLQPQQGVGFTTYIPSPLVENSSPFFNAPPTPFLCAGDTVTFLNSAVDPDGDQLIFSLVTPYRGFSSSGNPVPNPPLNLSWEVTEAMYNPGYSVNEPFGAGGYSFINASTGLTTFMAPNSGQYPIGVEIREYRNGNLIGIMRRDIQLVVIACPPNPAPDLSNVSAGNAGPTAWEMEEGDTLCFPVIFEDVNGDSLLLSALGEVFDGGLVTPTATINTPQVGLGTVQADFCWSTDCSLGRQNPYFFSVTATDNGCPSKSASEVYSIEVIPFTGSTMVNGENTPCEGSTETYTTDVFTDGAYTWNVSGGTILSGQGTNEVEVEWGSSGAATLTVTSTNFRGCVGDPFDFDVAVLPLPAIDAGADVSMCVGDSVTIGGSPTGPGGSFIQWGPDTDISDINAGNPEIYPMADTFYEVEVTSANSCSARDTVFVTVNSTSAQASDDVTICDGADTQLMVTTTAANILWTPAATLDSDVVADPVASPSSTTTYVVSVEDALGCTAEDSVTVSVVAQPLANAGPDDNICGFEYELQATPSVGNGEWIAIDPVNFSSIIDPNATASVLGQGTFGMIWRETNASLCVSEDTVMIQFIAQPDTDAGPDDEACGLNYTLQGVSSAGTAEWLFPAQLSLTDVNDPGTEVTASTFGTYTLELTEDNLGCRDTAQVMISFVETPTADAGMDDEICGNIYDLGAVPSVGTGIWTGPAGISFSDVNDPTAQVTTTVFGPQTLTWTEVNGIACTADAQVTITFNEVPVSDAGPDDVACGLNYDLQAQASVGIGTWTAPAGIVLSDMNDPNAQASAAAFGTYTITWAEDNAGCTDQAQVEITFTEVPSVDAGLDDDICGDEYTLGATSTIGIGTWTGSANVSFSDINDPNAVVSSTAFGTETITWTADNEGCDANNTVDITFLEIPEADAGADMALCGTEIDLAANASIGTGTWTGPAEISFSDINATDATSTSTSFGIYTLTWTEDSNGCVDSDEVQVEYLEVPDADAGLDEEICIGTSVLLDAQGGDTYSWSPSDGLSDSEIADPEANPSDTTLYTVTVSLANGCSDTDEMIVHVNPLPDVDAGADVDYLCYGDSIQLQATSSVATEFSWSPTLYLSDGNIATPWAGNLDTLLATQSVTYTVTATDDLGCESSDDVNIIYYPDVITNAGLDTLICQGEPVLLGGIPTAPTGSEYAWTPTENMNDSTLANPTVSPTETTTYSVITSNAVCTGMDLVTVIVEESPELPFSIEADPSCSGLRVTFVNEGDETLNYHWDFGDGDTSNVYSPSHQYAFNASYTVTLTATSELGCSYEAQEIVDASDFASYFEINVPNVFTPNGDGENDVFDINITGQIADCFYMEIFNRWGQTMFLSSGNETRWGGFTQSGEPVQPGVYFYVIEFNGLSYKGSVQVIR